MDQINVITLLVHRQVKRHEPSNYRPWLTPFDFQCSNGYQIYWLTILKLSATSTQDWKKQQPKSSFQLFIHSMPKINLTCINAESHMQIINCPRLRLLAYRVFFFDSLHLLVKYVNKTIEVQKKKKKKA